MTKMHTKRRAAKGAAFLDECDPGWENRVDTDTLDICSTGECVLGQLYGSFFDGLEELSLGGVEAGKLGMDGSYAGLSEYNKLNRRWVEEITFRRELATVLTEKEKVDA